MLYCWMDCICLDYYTDKHDRNISRIHDRHEKYPFSHQQQRRKGKLKVGDNIARMDVPRYLAGA